MKCRLNIECVDYRTFKEKMKLKKKNKIISLLLEYFRRCTQENNSLRYLAKIY